MRFDEFVHQRGLSVFPVDHFAGFAVQVGVPADWKPVNSAVGMRVWISRNDPPVDEFCTNMVLTMHRVEAFLDTGEVFSMLVEQQMQSVRCGHVLRRELASATEGPGVVGVLAMQITGELGTIASVSQTRIITTEQDTLIAQLTITADEQSPVDLAQIWLSVRAGTAARSASAAHHSGGRPPEHETITDGA